MAWHIFNSRKSAYVLKSHAQSGNTLLCLQQRRQRRYKWSCPINYLPDSVDRIIAYRLNSRYISTEKAPQPNRNPYPYPYPNHTSTKEKSDSKKKEYSIPTTSNTTHITPHQTKREQNTLLHTATAILTIRVRDQLGRMHHHLLLRYRILRFEHTHTITIHHQHPYRMSYATATANRHLSG